MRNKTVRTNNKIEHSVMFDSISDLMCYIDTHTENSVFRNKKLQSKKDGNYKFYQTNSYAEALNLLETGYKEVAKELTERLKNNSRNGFKNRPVYSVQGYQCCVPRYLQGLPDSMISSKRIAEKTKVINVYKAINYSYTVKPQMIIDESVKALRIVQMLENAGVKVNLYIVCQAYQAYEEIERIREEITMLLKIKNANERLNLSKISFPLVHPSFLRRIFFRFEEVYEDLELNSFQGNYGFPFNNFQIKKNEMYINKTMSCTEQDILNCKSVEQILSLK